MIIGGATDSPYSSTTGAAYGSAVANWVVANNLDGVDFDLENFGRDFTFGCMSFSPLLFSLHVCLSYSFSHVHHSDRPMGCRRYQRCPFHHRNLEDHYPRPPAPLFRYVSTFPSPLFPSSSLPHANLTLGNYGWADGYGKIYDLAPHIDFFLVQFYNNGPTTSYETVCLPFPSSLPPPSLPYILIDLLGTRILYGCFRHGDQPWRSSPQQDRSR